MTGSGRRLGAVLLLVVGIMAMHGLVSADHAAHRSASASTLPVPGPALEHAAAPAHARAPAIRPAPDLAATTGLSAPPSASLPDLSAAAVGLCLAVLLGVVLLRRATGGAWPTAPSRTRVTRAVRTSPPGRGPPRLLLAQLCVLRT